MSDARSPAPIERELRFTREDLHLFAVASGDRNPLHLDPRFARRTAFGSCVVHGALVAIGLLGVLPAAALAEIRSVRFWFVGAVLPDCASSARVSVSAKRPDVWEARLTGRGKLLVRAIAETDRRAFSRVLVEASSGRAPSDDSTNMRVIPADRQISELEPGYSIVGEYSPRNELLDVARRFGAEPLDLALLEGLAWASYVVGMELPGANGLFAGLTLAASDGAPPRAPAARQRITLRAHDRRLGRVLLDGVLSERSGATRCIAAIEAFDVPPTPALDAGALGISASAARRGEGAVVIGGSRGFGAALALSLLARGFDVHCVYSAASGSAAELARLSRRCRSSLHMHRLDARDPVGLHALAEELRSSDTPVVGLVLNAAPPPLAMGVTSSSGVELAEYVAESLRMTAVPLGGLLGLLDPASGWVVFCSSTALNAPPRDWPHYVTAKAALEGLAGWVAATAPQLRTVVLRPPAMRTDLTSTPSGRIAPIAPETVARWMGDRLTDGRLPVGLSVLEPVGFDAPAPDAGSS